jgi:hypothetical protein
VRAMHCMKTFYNLTGPYDGLRGRIIARKGRLCLFKIFEECGEPCNPFWLLYIRDFQAKTDGERCQWFIAGTSIVSDAPGKHLFSEGEGRNWFAKLELNFLDTPKRVVSESVLQHLAEGRKKLQAKKVQELQQ